MTNCAGMLQDDGDDGEGEDAEDDDEEAGDDGETFEEEGEVVSLVSFCYAGSCHFAFCKN